MDVAEPGRASAALLHLLSQRQHPADKPAVGPDHPVSVIFGHGFANVPADDGIVERLRSLRIRGLQLIPDEVALRIRAGARPCFGRSGLSNVSHGSISFS